VDNSFPVHVADGIENLLNGTTDKRFFALEGFHESSIAGILHHQEDMILIIEVSIELDDIGMVQVVMNFQFGDELLFHFVFDDRRLKDLFDGAHETCGFMHAQVDIAEFAGTDAFSELEVSDFEAAGW
jgi:hypothetical protein